MPYYCKYELLDLNKKDGVFLPWATDWLLFIINKPRSYLYTHNHIMMSDDEYTRFLAGKAKLLDGVPCAYLIGQMGFYGLDFFVNEHTLVPRPDSELLVDLALAQKPARVLDLGTGTGCIGISIVKNSNAHALLVDKSIDALAVAQKNITRHHAHALALHSNWYAGVAGRFDVIVANPPYLAPNDRHLPTLKHEPMSALIADDDGFLDIQTIIDGARDFLMPDGALIVEHGNTQAARVLMMMSMAGFVDIKTHHDLGGHARATMGIWRAL